MAADQEEVSRVVGYSASTRVGYRLSGGLILFWDKYHRNFSLTLTVTLVVAMYLGKLLPPVYRVLLPYRGGERSQQSADLQPVSGHPPSRQHYVAQDT